MKKILACLSMMLLVVLLVGCTTSTPTEATINDADNSGEDAVVEDVSTEEAVDKEPVTLSFVRPGLGDDALLEVDAEMAPFYEEYPWISLDTQVLAPPDLSAKVQTSIAGGAPPDIVQGLSVGDALTYVANDQLLNLAPYAEAEGFDWQSYYGSENIDLYNPEGELYCVSESSDTRTLAYNKDMFDAAGLDYPTDDWTWDDLLAAAQVLTQDLDGDGQTDQYGFVTHTWDYQPWIWAAGGSFYNEDYTEVLSTDPVVMDTLQFLLDMRFEYGVWPPEEVTSTFPEPGFMFAQGQVAMYTARWIPDTVFFFADLPFNWDVVMMPMNPDTGLRAAGQGGGCVGVFAATEHPEEAYQVWKWMTSDEGVYARSVGSSGVPMLPAGSSESHPLLSEAFNSVAVPSNARAFVDMLPFTRYSDLPIANSAEVTAAISPFLDELWLGTKTIDEVAPLIKAAVDPLLQQ